jgi:hypothetical protein
MKKHFFLFLSITSILISILALVLSFADIDTNKLEFSTNSFLTVTGAIMSAMGFVLGIYFALLAVKAYGDIKKIEDQVIKIEMLAQKAETVNNSINSILNSHTNHFITTIEYQMDLDATLMNALDKNKSADLRQIQRFEKRREELTRIRARMSYEFIYLEINKRKQYLTELGGLGNEEDLPCLSDILTSENEGEEIKAITKIVIQNIKQRIGQK